MGSKIIKERSLDLSGLPKKKSKIDWSKSKECKIPFIYGDEKGIFIVKDYIKEDERYFLLIEYNDKEYKIATNNFMKFKFGNIIGTYNKNYIYNVGEIIETKSGKIKILEQIQYIRNNNSAEKGYKYECLIDGNIDCTTETIIKEGGGCNVCCPRTVKVLKGYNDIATTHPYLVEYFKYIEDTYTHTYGSSDKTWIKCPDCGFEEELCINDIVLGKFSCKKCGSHYSYPNKFMLNVLEQLNVDFETEKKFDWCLYLFQGKYRQGYYDFYISSLNLIIEMDGSFHNNDNTMNGQTAKESKFIDDEKDRLAIEHGIEVIRINCDYNRIANRFKYIKQNTSKNIRLNELFDLSKIYWERVLEYCMTNLNKTICEEWNKTKDVKHIIKKFKKSRENIRNILNLGNTLNWCNYKDFNKIKSDNYYKTIELWNDGTTRIDIEKILQLSQPTISSYLTKANKYGLCKYEAELITTEIYCQETNEIYESLSDCKRKFLKEFNVELDVSCISKVCRNKLNQHKSYTFKYKSDITQEEIAQTQQQSTLTQEI
jgi:predicted transcriptional regulator